MDQLLPLEQSSRPGFRLHKLEVYNWGTFDSTRGEVYTMRPDGRTTLLIGQNGSGKSTLVDALLTLLVRPGVRNYNVAAGARKQERDERTYIKGAYGRFSRDEDNRAVIQFLRPEGTHYAALLACFRNEETNESFTVAQLLYLNSEGRAEKVYCLAPGERSITEDFGELAGTDRVRQRIEERGYRATLRYKEFHSWFARQTRVQPMAMDMLNQTVAVKDIQSLNQFIRKHMLEAKPWAKKVDSLLTHFTQLSEAHQSLVRVRRQFELLEPVAAKGEKYRREAERLAQIERLLEAADSFFHRKTLELLRPERDRREEELKHVRRRKGELQSQIAEVQEECRRYKNEIEQAGGQRLRQIPLLIDMHGKQAATKREADARYHEALRGAGFPQWVADAGAFAAVRGRLPGLLRECEETVAEKRQKRDELIVQRGTLRDRLREDERELEALSRRQGNLPESFAELRQRLCRDLGLSEKELPFAAELIAVKPEERAWEASIEMVLRGFALSLLVPGRHYHLVSQYVEQTRLADAGGQGRRLVYLKVGKRTPSETRPASHPQSLVQKVQLREKHPLVPWVKAELEERFDYRCCQTLEELQVAHGLALTRRRHVKRGNVRHEKDDRPRTIDPRHFVLGWDNREKRRRLAEEIRRLQDEHEHLENRLKKLDGELDGLARRQTAARVALEFGDFQQIDYAAEERQIEALEFEKRQLEEQNDTIRLLKQRLAEADSRQQALQKSRDDALRTEDRLQRDVQESKRLIANAEAKLQEREADGALARQAETFDDLEACFAEEPLSAETLFDRERQFIDDLRDDLDRVRKKIEPLGSDLCAAMNRFLREFPHERTDLDARAEYLESFLDLRDHIRREDLPRHERRFKERLNRKVIEEIGLLNGALEAEQTAIESKIETLNESLRQLEYRPGTYMRLEPRPVRDREVAEFREALSNCLAGTFEGTPEADEARFLRIQELITRLREEPRWREKVTDVRRWFDFAAREIDDVTGEERGYYEDSTGQSGGEKAKLAFTILVAAIAYQYDIDPDRPGSNRFHFVIVDEMFSRVDDQYAEYALELFKKFGLQLLIVAPLDAKARVTEPYVGSYLHVVKDPQTNRSEVLSMTAREFEEAVAIEGNGRGEAVPEPNPQRWRQVPR